MSFSTGRRAVLIILGLFVGVTAYLGPNRKPVPLPVLAPVPNFQLTDQLGGLVSKEELLGHPWIASFIYSTCPGPCPLVVQRISRLAKRLPSQDRVMLVSISVDPERDTPEALAAYAKLHSIQRDQWLLLTGEPELVFQLIRGGFLLSVGQASDMEKDGKTGVAGAAPSGTVLTDQGPVVHSTRLALVDAEGQIRGYYESLEEPEMERLVQDLSRLASKP